MRKTRSDRVFDICNSVLMLLIMFFMLYPLYFTVIASFSDPYEVSQGSITFLIKGFTTDAYKNVFKNSTIWTGYRNTLLYTLFGTLFNLFLTIPTAYVLSKKNLPGRNFFSWFFLFTMYFSGGMIPTYLTVRDLGLLNKPVTLVILGGMSIFNMIVSRVYFETSIPETIYEAARIDGCSEMRMFFRIALPLSAPIIAVMALFYGVAHWNDYFTALLYITKTDLYPLQIVLRNILIMNQNALSAIDIGSATDDAVAAAIKLANMAEAMKYALIFIASAPLLIAYPFVQKYFVKGIMIGSLKG